MQGGVRAHPRGRRHRHEQRDSYVTIKEATSAGCNELLDIPIIEKSDARVRKRTEAPTLVSHIFGQPGARRLSAAAPDLWWKLGNGSRLRFCDAACAPSSETQIGLLLITVSFERMKSA